jgi:hypothetical protein
MINSQEILNQLDLCNAEFTFPMLDNGYVYPAGTNLTAYRDDKRWVIIIEIIGFNYRGGGHDGISNCLHIFGNCLTFEPGTNNENFISLTNDANNCSTFDGDELFYLNPECESFDLRGEIIPLPQNKELYKLSGIDLEEENRINAFELLRLLDAQNHHILVATEKEIRARIPGDLPLILELRHWFHPDVANDELPSGNETFKQIAEVLESGDSEYYQPSRSPNTHWKNWPDGGTL